VLKIGICTPFITFTNPKNPIRVQLGLGAYSTWGHRSRCFSWSTWSGLL